MLVRNNIRSFRFSDRVLKILEDFEGDIARLQMGFAGVLSDFEKI